MSLQREIPHQQVFKNVIRSLLLHFVGGKNFGWGEILFLRGRQSSEFAIATLHYFCFMVIKISPLLLITIRPSRTMHHFTFTYRKSLFCLFLSLQFSNMFKNCHCVVSDARHVMKPGVINTSEFNLEHGTF